MAGFCEFAAGLQTPRLADGGPSSPKVSGGYLKYARFRETAAGDQVRQDCAAAAAVSFPYFSGDASGKSGVCLHALSHGFMLPGVY